MERDYKKKNGIFGTPKSISEYLISRIDFNKVSKILEPGFGFGSIIDSILIKIKNCSSLYAFDREIDFVKEIHSKYKLDKSKVCCVDFFSKTSFDNIKFDLIIGNPPYGADLTKDNLNYINSNIDIFPDKSKESSVLFIYKCISMLTDGGELYFILPATLTRVMSYSKLRTFIKKNTYVLEIFNLGQKFAEVGYELIILHIKKKGLGITKPKNIKIINLIKSDKEDNHLLSYKYFEKQDIFPLFVDDNIAKILTKIETNSQLLGSFIDMPRGKSYRLIKTNNINEINRVYCARNISKYAINELPAFVSNNLYDKTSIKPKILIQNLAYKIVCCLDRSGITTNETINNLTIKESAYSYEYILAILNSSLMTFYIQNKLTNLAKLNIHMDKPYVGQIPIKAVSLTEQQKIVNLVKKLEIEPKNILVRNQLENILFDLYGVDEKEIDGKYLSGKKNI